MTSSSVVELIRLLVINDSVKPFRRDCGNGKIVSGWKWHFSKEHINVLELRALEATIRWRVERTDDFHCRFVHLTDSLVCLHTVSRGRSSSRKLRTVMCRLNSVLLASGVSPVFGYVHTDQNPADKPSRWKVRTKFRNVKSSLRK